MDCYCDVPNRLVTLSEIAIVPDVRNGMDLRVQKQISLSTMEIVRSMIWHALRLK